MPRDRPAAGVGDTTLEGQTGAQIAGTEVLFVGTATTTGADTPLTVSTGVSDQGAKDFQVGLASDFGVASSVITFEETSSLLTAAVGSLDTNTARYSPQYNGGESEWQVVVEDGAGDLAVEVIVREA